MKPHAITQAERTALQKRLPLGQLMLLSGIDRLTPDLLTRPAILELELKRRILGRLKAGEICLMQPCPSLVRPHLQTYPGAELRLDLAEFWHRYSEAL